jgi:hypothetical protein
MKVCRVAWLVFRLVIYTVKEQQEVREDVKAMRWKKKKAKMLEMTTTRTTKQKYEGVPSCCKAQTTSNNQQQLEPNYLVV